MSNFNQNKYIQEYEKNNYTKCLLRLKSKEAEILAEYSQNLGISKNALLQKCLVYCYNEMIDVSNIELSKPEKQANMTIRIMS